MPVTEFGVSGVVVVGDATHLLIIPSAGCFLNEAAELEVGQFEVKD
jgi:hypothetical protein